MKKIIKYLTYPENEAKVKQIGKVIFTVLIIGLIIIDGRKFLKELSFGATLQLLRTLKPANVSGFLLISLFAVWLTFLYDYTAFRRLKVHISALRVMKVSWIATTFNNVAGFGALPGLGARVLLYKRDQIKEKDIRRMSLLTIPASITGLGCLMILSLAGMTGVGVLVQTYKWIPLLMVCFVLYVPIYCWFTDIRFTWFHLSMSHKPGFEETRTRLMLTAVSLLEWTAASLVLWMIISILSPGVTLLQTVGLFSIATSAGILSMLPGGIGIFDIILLTGLQAYGTTAQEALAVLLMFRFFYYAVPLLISAVLSIGELSPFLLRYGKKLTDLIRVPTLSRNKPAPGSFSMLMGELAAKAVYILIISGGVLMVVSAALPDVSQRVLFLTEYFKVPLLQLSHRISLLIGLSILLLADEIRLRIRRAWTVMIILLIAGGFFTFLKGLNIEELLYLMGVLVMLLVAKPVFNRISVPVNVSRLFKPLLITAFMAGIYIFSGQPHPFAYMKTHGGLGMLHFTPDDYIFNGLAALAVSWIGYAVWLGTMKKPVLDPLPPSYDDFDKLASLLKISPGNSHTHLLYLNDVRFFWASKDAALIPYREAGECLIALGEPLGDKSLHSQALEEFRLFAEYYGFIPVFYQVTEAFLPTLHDQGFDFFKLGEEAFIKLDEFDLNLPHMKSFRNVRNRIEKEGFVFEILEPSRISSSMKELQQISDAWLSGRREKQFSLGFFDERYLEKSPVAVIRSSAGILVAFASLMPVTGRNEISVDLMRYLPESPNGIMDYLFLRLFEWAQSNGYKRFNLGMAPLSNVGLKDFSTNAERLAGFMYIHGRKLYSFAGLYQYKKKFHPDWRPIYLAYPRDAKLSKVIVRVANLINRGKVDTSYE